MTEFDRRKVLMASGTALTVGLAGCLGGGGGNGDDNGNESENGTGNGDASPEEQADQYLSDNSANLYDGTDSIVDETGSGEVTIDVGAGSEGYAYEPAAVRVDSGTDIVWEWVGGNHNVNVQEGPETFTSETVSEEGHTFSETLEDAGAYRYRCDPHQGLGMYGAVIVE